MRLALASQNFVNFDEFSDYLPENNPKNYELHNGLIIAMPFPAGKHSQIAGFLLTEFSLEIRRQKLPYLVPRECLIKVDNFSGYAPDVIVLDQNLLSNEPRWERESTITKGDSIKLVVEVVSNNWSDDYALKLDAYETLGIQEYWIVDYLGIGGKKFIGYPKRPTLTIYQLMNSEYQPNQFRDEALIKSTVFSGLELTANQIFKALL